MVTAELKQRLIDQAVFTKMHGAAQLAVALERRQFSADGYVMRAKAQPQPNVLINAVEQQLIETYSIVFWVTSPGDVTGDKIADEIDAKCQAIMTALLGWAPTADYSPMEYAGGQLGRFEVGAALWEENYRTETYVRAA